MGIYLEGDPTKKSDGLIKNLNNDLITRLPGLEPRRHFGWHPFQAAGLGTFER